MTSSHLQLFVSTEINCLSDIYYFLEKNQNTPASSLFNGTSRHGATSTCPEPTAPCAHQCNQSAHFDTFQSLAPSRI